MEKSATRNGYRIRKLTTGALFAAFATVLMFIEFPLPFLPPFLEFDFSGVLILIASFMFGPLQAVLICLVKNLIHTFSSDSGGIGQLADFITIACFVVTAGLFYRRKKDKRHALLGCLAATLVIGGVGVIANKFILIPFYSNLMPIEAIVSACSAVNPAIDSMNAYYLFGALPFNLIKGALISGVTLLCYKRLSYFLKKWS